MNKNATISLRVNKETKQNAEALFSEFGITLGDAISIFLNVSIMKGGLPFEVKRSVPNQTTLAAMKESEDMMNGKIKSEPQDIHELFKELGI